MGGKGGDEEDSFLLSLPWLTVAFRARMESVGPHTMGRASCPACATIM